MIFTAEITSRTKRTIGIMISALLRTNVMP
jgi:hypothetical protein